MVDAKLTPITLEMFQPEISGRSLQTNRQLGRLVNEFSGRGRVRFHLGIKAGGAWSEEEALAIDETVLGSIKRRYSLPDSSDPRDFYMQQQKQAIGVIGHIGSVLPELGQELELKDEISLLSDSPSDLFRLASLPEDVIDQTLAYEVHRHLLLSVISGLVNARTLNGRLRTVLSDVHRQFNAQLFEGPEGAGTRLNLTSIHDDETNEVVGFPEHSQRIPPTAHVKRSSFLLRRISDIGLVYTSPRKKDDDNAILKSLAKAVNNGGKIDMDTVRDEIGMMFVLMSDSTDTEKLADRVLSVAAEGLRKIIHVESDNKVDIDHGQSAEIRMSRRQVWFEDMQVPLELMFFDRENYLNSQLEVGRRDPQTGLFEGRAHELYDLRRVSSVLPLLYPEVVYGVDLQPIVVRRMKQKAEELRARYKAA